MKAKTSVTLSQELLDAIENELRTSNRSAILEEAAREFLRSRRGTARLNDEALDTLDYLDIE